MIHDDVEVDVVPLQPISPISTGDGSHPPASPALGQQNPDPADHPFDKPLTPISDILIRFTQEVRVEKRGAKYHRERLGEALREEIETIVEGELGDPRIGLASVTAVELAEDARSARIYVSVDGGDEEAVRSLEGLTAAVGFIRREVAENLRLRRPPELYFQLDRSHTYGARIDELLKRTQKKRRRG